MGYGRILSMEEHLYWTWGGLCLLALPGTLSAGLQPPLLSPKPNLCGLRPGASCTPPPPPPPPGLLGLSKARFQQAAGGWEG